MQKSLLPTIVLLVLVLENVYGPVFMDAIRLVRELVV